MGERCNVELDFDTLHLPGYDVPKGYTKEEYLKELCIRGDLKIDMKSLPPEIEERFNYEFNTIVNMGYTDYFF